MVGCGKVASHRVMLLQDLVAMELCAVIECDSPEFIPVLEDGHHGCIGGFQHCSGTQFLDYDQASLAFDQGKDTVPLVITHDCIAFPVPQNRSGFDFWRSGGYMSFAWKYASGILCIVTLSTNLRHYAEVPVQSASTLFVGENKFVDCFVTHGKIMMMNQVISNLFRTPLALEQVNHQAPLVFSKLGSTPRPMATGYGITLGHWAGVVTGRAPVALEFPADGGRMPSHSLGQFSLASIASQSTRYGISFFLGELSIFTHVRIPFPGRNWISEVSQLSLFLGRKLHLVIESA